MDDSATMWDQVTQSYDEYAEPESYEKTKTIPTNFHEKKATCKMQNFYILLAFLLISIELLIPVSIYSYLIKYQAKQKHLLPMHFTNNALKELKKYK